jgi:FAD/FMN-containing dehydrogenase
MQNAVRRFEQAVQGLEAKMRGRVTARGNEGYEDARKVWNGAVDHHPVAIAFCESAEDVQTAVQIARAHNMPYRFVAVDTTLPAVRSGQTRSSSTCL